MGNFNTLKAEKKLTRFARIKAAFGTSIRSVSRKLVGIFENGAVEEPAN